VGRVWKNCIDISNETYLRPPFSFFFPFPLCFISWLELCRFFFFRLCYVRAKGMSSEERMLRAAAVKTVDFPLPLFFFSLLFPPVTFSQLVPFRASNVSQRGLTPNLLPFLTPPPPSYCPVCPQIRSDLSRRERKEKSDTEQATIPLSFFFLFPPPPPSEVRSGAGLRGPF